jgi:AcrR family transcriptional regulator
MIRKPANKQHHGNLREALILAGLEILEEEGLTGLTLRKCAARAGVSHAAPAHHFEGMPGLKAAISARGYAIFEKLMKDGIAEAGPDKINQIKGMCQGYLRFATEHEALFNLIFSHPDSFPHNPERLEAVASARQILTDTCGGVECGKSGHAATEVAVWSLVHGYAKLIEIGRVTPGSGDSRDVSLDDILPTLALRAPKA